MKILCFLLLVKDERCARGGSLPGLESVSEAGISWRRMRPAHRTVCVHRALGLWEAAIVPGEPLGGNRTHTHLMSDCRSQITHLKIGPQCSPRSEILGWVEMFNMEHFIKTQQNCPEKK